MVVGGAEKVLIDLVNHLDADRYEVTVIALFRKSVYNDYVFQFEEGFNSNVKYRFLIDNTNKMRYRIFNFFHSKLNTLLIYRWLINEKFDIEIAFYEGWPTEFVAYSNQNSCKIAWLHTQQERLYQRISKKRKDKLYEIYNKYNHVISVSDAVGRSFSNIFPGHRTSTVYNPFNLKLIQSKANQYVDYHPKGNVVNFLTVGRLIKLKGYTRLINTLNRLRNEGYLFHLTLIGEGHLKPELKRLTESYDLRDYIKFIGFTTNPYIYIANSDLFICSSFVEGLSTVAIESMALNVPVLATNCGGMDEIITNNVNGLICENSEEGLYLSLKQILQNLDLLLKFKTNLQKNQKTFKEKYSFDRITNFLDAL